MEASFRSKIDETQLSIEELGNTHRRICNVGRSPAKLPSADCVAWSTENTGSSCQAEAKQATDMQVAVQECTQRLRHVELAVVHMKDDIKSQGTALEVIQRDCKVQQTLLKADVKQTCRHEVKSKASNHGISVEMKAAHEHSVGSSVNVRALHRKTPAVRRVIRSALNAQGSAAVSSNLGHEGTVSVRVAAAPDPMTTVKQQPQQPQQAQQLPPPSQQQPQHHRQIAAAATLAPLTGSWGMLSSGAVPTANRQVSPSSSHANRQVSPSSSHTNRQVSPSSSHVALPPQLQTERSALAASPNAAQWTRNRSGPKLPAWDRASSVDLHQHA